MSDPLFCELYIDTDEPLDEIEKAVDEACRATFHDLKVEAIVYPNDNFDASARQQSPYHFIEASQYYVEVGIDGDPPEQVDDFQSGVASLVKELRAGGRFVTASCDFEEVVADLTGWNWTKAQPEPPGRARS